MGIITTARPIEIAKSMLENDLTIDEHIDFIGHAYKINNYKEKADYYIKSFKELL